MRITRITLWRGLAFGLLLLPLVGPGATAQPPDPFLPSPPVLPDAPVTPEKLKADIAALAAARKLALEDGAGVERARLQAELQAILKRINSIPTGPVPGSVRPSVPTPSPKSKAEPIDTSKPVDTLRLAMNLFRDNDYEAALRAFHLLDPGQLAREDRAFVRYMTACCLRQLGRIAEATAIFTEVANSTDDEFVAGCAVWQLSLLRSGQELEAQLEQLRARAKSR